ncbi:MAG: DUF3084 domain-containing protein [Cyanothece sp. SIO2G6]|nr:DUF3084 domain-containing protein [Cyanothece sp. SIO2G6]
MAAGILLVGAMLILGGVLATAGDRIGMKVGKARLSLFNLRPRQTATLVTILTGGVISATTLGILFLLNDQLRTGVFDLEDIQEDLAAAQLDLEAIRDERDTIDQELAQAQVDQEKAAENLRRINTSLRESEIAQAEAESQLADKQAELTAANTKFRQTQVELSQVSRQATNLRTEIQQLQQRQQQQTQEFKQQREALIEQDAQIFEKTQQLQELEVQRALLIDELQTLRSGEVALFRNQRLAVGVVSDVTPAEAAQTVDQILRRANQTVLDKILPGTQPIERQVVLITKAEVERLIAQLRDGREYVIRILSAGNYLVGEPCVSARLQCIQVTAEAVPNELIFFEGETIAAAAIGSDLNTQELLSDRFNLLISATEFRAQQAGVLAETVQIAGGDEVVIRDFFNQILNYQQTIGATIDLKTVASHNIYTVGPLDIELVAEQRGEVVFSTLALPQAETELDADATNPDDAGLDDANPDDASSDDANPDDANPDDASPDDASPDNANPDE